MACYLRNGKWKIRNQKHEVYDHLTTINNGIDILTNKGTKARAVFNGKVAAVIVLPGGKKAVLIQHGEFFTMYSNLSKVFVEKGDNVSTQEDIGAMIMAKQKFILKFGRVIKNKTLVCGLPINKP